LHNEIKELDNMEKKSKALINYYARLILKGVYTMDRIPLELQKDVEEAMDSEKEYLEKVKKKDE